MIGLVAVLLVALPLISSALAVDVNSQELDESNLCGERVRACIRQRQWRIIWFFKGAEKDSIEGTVIARDRNILIVTDDQDNRFNIILPGRWNIGSDVVTLNQVFDEGYISIGETVTLEVLKRTVTNENRVSLTIIFGYEITTTEYNIYVVLPININA